MKKILLTLAIVTCILTGNAQITFEKTYDFWDRAEAQVVFEEDDGYVLAGSAILPVNSTHHDYLFLIKTDLYGDTLWLKEYDFGIMDFGNLSISATAEDAFGNKYFALSVVNYSPNFIKFDSQWNIVWEKRLDHYFIFNMFITSDGNIATVGHNENNENQGLDTYYLTKFDLDGNVIWTSPNISYEKYGRLEFPTFMELPNSTIVVIANWWNTTYYITKPSEIRTYSSSGDSLSCTIFNPDSDYSSITQSALYGNELLSLCNNYDELAHPRFIRHHIDGVILQETEFDSIRFIKRFLLKDNNTVITQSGYNKLYLSGYTINGDSLWSSLIGSGQADGTKIIYSMKMSKYGGIILTGLTSVDYPTTFVPYMAVTDSIGRILPLSIPDDEKIELVKVFPNPATTSVIFETPYNQPCTLVIYDVRGRVYDQISLTNGKAVYNTRNLEQGVYFYKIISDNQTFSGKLVISAK